MLECEWQLQAILLFAQCFLIVQSTLQPRHKIFVTSMAWSARTWRNWCKWPKHTNVPKTRFRLWLLPLCKSPCQIHHRLNWHSPLDRLEEIFLNVLFWTFETRTLIWDKSPIYIHLIAAVDFGVRLFYQCHLVSMVNVVESFLLLIWKSPKTPLGLNSGRSSIHPFSEATFHTTLEYPSCLFCISNWRADTCHQCRQWPSGHSAKSAPDEEKYEGERVWDCVRDWECVRLCERLRVCEIVWESEIGAIFWNVREEKVCLSPESAPCTLVHKAPG